MWFCQNEKDKKKKKKSCRKRELFKNFYLFSKIQLICSVANPFDSTQCCNLCRRSIQQCETPQEFTRLLEISPWCNFQVNLSNSVSSEAVITILCCQAIQHSRCIQLVPFPTSWLGLLSCHLLENTLGYLIHFLQDVVFLYCVDLFFLHVNKEISLARPIPRMILCNPKCLRHL